MKPGKNSFDMVPINGGLNAVLVLTATKICSRCYQSGIHDIILVKVIMITGVITL